MNADVLQTSVPKAYRALAEIVSSSGMSPGACAEELCDDLRDQFSYFRYFTLAKAFAEAGAPTYVLSHSIAAALTATRSPVLPFSHCPYPAFFIEVPSEFLPLPDVPNANTSSLKRWISVIATSELRAVSLHAKGIVSVMHLHVQNVDAPIREEGLRDMSSDAARAALFEMRIGIRLASNVVAYVTAHKENVTERSRRSPGDMRILDVGVPRDVVVDRAFRTQVQQLITARTIPRARGVLSHLVRGHWRRAPEKDGLIWIAPYQRGDLNIGRIVERTDRL